MQGHWSRPPESDARIHHVHPVQRKFGSTVRHVECLAEPQVPRGVTLLPEDYETADRVSQRGAHDNVGREMGAESKPGKSYQPGEAVCHVRKPALARIAARNHRGHGKRRDGVAGREAAVAPDPTALGVEPAIDRKSVA